jgi:hypothetical protein
MSLWFLHDVRPLAREALNKSVQHSETVFSRAVDARVSNDTSDPKGDSEEDFRMMSASKEATSMPDARRLRALYSVKK